MSSLAIDIADAVAAELAGKTFSVPVAVERNVLPEYELADLTTAHATVVPKAIQITAASRAMSQTDVQIDIGVQRKIVSDVDAEVAELCGMVEEVMVFLDRRSLAAKPEAVWVHAAYEPIYSPEHSAERRLFTGVVTVTYRVLR